MVHVSPFPSSCHAVPSCFLFQVDVEDGARLLVEKVLVAASAACGAQTLTASLELVQGYHYFESLKLRTEKMN